MIPAFLTASEYAARINALVIQLLTIKTVSLQPMLGWKESVFMISGIPTLPYWQMRALIFKKFPAGLGIPMLK